MLALLSPDCSLISCRITYSVWLFPYWSYVGHTFNYVKRLLSYLTSIPHTSKTEQEYT